MMKNMNRGVISQGIVCPIVREGDDVVKIVVDSVLDETWFTDENRIYSVREWYLSGVDNKPSYFDKDGDEYKVQQIDGYHIQDKSVIGITESLVARANGLYVTVDEVAEDIKKKFGKNPTVCLANPIYSRNRFSIILKGIARAAKKVIIVMPELDEVGNPRGVNQFTGVDIEKYYKELCESENCECEILHELRTIWNDNPNLVHRGVDSIDEKIDGYIDCGLHVGPLSSLSLQSWHCFSPLYTLADICSDKNPDYGLLGTNKATEERLKLFPTKALADKVCEEVKARIKEKTGKDVIVLVYGDGCFKDPVGGIWEFADPDTCPGYTDKELLESTPNEIKLKYWIDRGFTESAINSQIEANAYEDNKGLMRAQGTTPRVYKDLLASLMDLTSGSGDRGTPVVLIQNYFR